MRQRAKGTRGGVGGGRRRMRRRRRKVYSKITK